MKATGSVTLGIKVQCERCQNIFEYERVLSEEVSSIDRSAEDLASECETRIKNRVTASVQRSSLSELSVRKCPKCKHIQSWMSAAQEEERRMTMAVSSGIVAIASTIIIFKMGILPKFLSNFIFFILLAIFTGIMCFLLFKKIYSLFRKKNGEQAALPTSDGPLHVKINNVSSINVWEEQVY
jgi:phage FluMu protein Com